MKPNHQKIPNDSFEYLLRDTLQSQMGSPPSKAVWARIAEEITQPPRRWSRAWFASIFQRPLFQSAFILACLVMLTIQPLYYGWTSWNTPSSLPPVMAPVLAPLTPPIPERDLIIQESIKYRIINSNDKRPLPEEKTEEKIKNDCVFSSCSLDNLSTPTPPEEGNRSL